MHKLKKKFFYSSPELLIRECHLGTERLLKPWCLNRHYHLHLLVHTGFSLGLCILQQLLKTPLFKDKTSLKGMEKNLMLKL